MNLLKRTWADVDLDRLERNWRKIRAFVPEHARILGVVKADAYGHGAVPVAQAMTEIGVDYLAVSSFDEALQLRRGAIMLPILILGYTPPEFAQKLAELQITQTIHSLEYARALDDRLQGVNRTLNVHVKFDTGMSRLGFATDDATIADAVKLPNLRITGTFTHFAAADSLAPEDVAYTELQYDRFCKAASRLEACGAPLELRHCCNSGATVLYPQYAMDMVRPGILLYGVHPSADTEPYIPLEPIMTLRTTISQIREIRKGTSVSYGRTFTAPRDMRIAVLAIGYADGLSRALSGKMQFSLRGRSIPQIGRICMDLCMADVTHVPDAALGDEVTVFGDAPALSAAELAALTDTIPYEAFCVIGKRVPHVYYRGGENVDLLRYIVQ